MAQCWEVRPCPKDLKDGCGFAKSSKPCTIKCHFATCRSPKCDMVFDISVLAAWDGLPVPAKEGCYYCRYFLDNARVSPKDG